MRWHLSPTGTTGGWRSAEPLPAEDARALAEIVRGARAVVWFGAPKSPGLAGSSARLATSYAIDLRDGCDAARARWERAARRQARSAHRAGVSVGEAKGWVDWTAYFRSYLDTAKLWGTPTSHYALSLFRLLREARSPSVRLSLVHDWFQGYHGSERVVEAIRSVLFERERQPEVLTFNASRSLLPRDLARAIVRESRLTRLPGWLSRAPAPGGGGISCRRSGSTSSTLPLDGYEL